MDFLGTLCFVGGAYYLWWSHCKKNDDVYECMYDIYESISMGEKNAPQG